jgi:hypothetical protein
MLASMYAFEVAVVFALSFAAVLKLGLEVSGIAKAVVKMLCTVW